LGQPSLVEPVALGNLLGPGIHRFTRAFGGGLFLRHLAFP
jgi:hypothetical protein